MIARHLHFDSIASTHSYALEHGGEFPDRTVITADFQTEGRGRCGREWISGREESILLSILLKPKISPQDATLITPVFAVAITDALKNFGIDASIRWPNDVMVKDKKIAGILAKASLTGDELSFIVASVGLNLRQDESELDTIDRPATSIFAETGNQVSRRNLQAALIKRFKELYDEFLKDGFSRIVGLWREKMSLIGEDVLIDLGGQYIEYCSRSPSSPPFSLQGRRNEESPQQAAGSNYIEGRVESFGNDGSIVIHDRDGKMNVLHSGEVVKLNRR